MLTKTSAQGNVLGATPQVPPPKLACKGSRVGKLLDRVKPVTKALPEASTAIPVPCSASLPPRKVK